MKNLSQKLLYCLGILLTLSACNAEDLTTPDEYLKNEYMVNWIKRNGLIDPNHDWNMAQHVNAHINAESFGQGYIVSIYNADPANGGVLIGRTSQSGVIGLDVVKGMENVYVRAYDPTGTRFQSGVYPIKNGEIEIQKLSRADGDEQPDDGNANGTDGYQWILACEDLGSTGDTDFNDVVVGINYIDNTLTITPLAAGGVLGAKVCYGGQEFEIHQAFGKDVKDSGSYTMINTTSFQGPGEPLVIHNVNNFTMSNQMGGISVKVLLSGKVEEVKTIIEAPTPGTAPQIICVPGGWEWPSERTDITVAYNQFKNWSKDQTLSAWTANKNASRIIPRSTTATTNVRTGLIQDMPKIKVNGDDRKYEVYVSSKAATSTSKIPVVFSLHGASNHISDYHPITKELAENEGFIAVYPQGLTRAFPGFGGTATGWWANTDEDSSDLDFFKEIIKEVKRNWNIDESRIYCCGFSNGGMMTYEVANSASDIFAACASIEGFPVNEFHHRHHGDRPVPFLHIHGKNDDFVHYQFSKIIRDNMVARNGCDPGATTTVVNGPVDGDKKTTKTVYTAGTDGADYVYYEVPTLGHNASFWNGNNSFTVEGKSADQIMWDFIKTKQLSSATNTLKWRLNIDTEDYNPISHGWTSTNGRTIRYGTKGSSDETTAPQNSDGTTYGKNAIAANVWRGIQLKAGTYYLKFSTTTRNADIYVMLENQSDPTSHPLMMKTTGSTGDVIMPFSISAYGEYSIHIHKNNPAEGLADAKFSLFEIRSGSQSDQNCTAATFPGMGTFVEVTQAQPDPAPDGFNLATKTTDTNSGAIVYESTDVLTLAFKMTNIDITGCDYVVIEFESIDNGWTASFTGTNKVEDCLSIPASSNPSSFSYVIPEAVKTSGKLPEITMLRLWGGSGTITAKVKHVYLHKTN